MQCNYQTGKSAALRARRVSGEWPERRQMLADDACLKLLGFSIPADISGYLRWNGWCPGEDSNLHGVTR